MAFSVLITLTSTGSDTGPTMNLYSNIDSFSVPFETGVAKASLISGYLSSLVPNGTVTVRVVSPGVCYTAVDLPISGFTTTTTTSTTSTSTTTTTSTTSTTTTATPPSFTITYSLDAAVTDARINGVSVPGFTYPINSSDTPVSEDFTPSGVGTVAIDLVGTPGSPTLRITDSGGNHDEAWIGNGTYTFTSIDLDNDITFTMF